MIAKKDPKKAPGKMGRPVTMPGVLGALVEALGGVPRLAIYIGTSERTLRAWARNERSMDALAASKANDLCRAYAVPRGQLFRFDDDGGIYVACTTRDGWVSFLESPSGWENRVRMSRPYDPKALLPADARALAAAEKSGYPY